MKNKAVFVLILVILFHTSPVNSQSTSAKLEENSKEELSIFINSERGKSKTAVANAGGKKVSFEYRDESNNLVTRTLEILKAEKVQWGYPYRVHYYSQIKDFETGTTYELADGNTWKMPTHIQRWKKYPASAEVVRIERADGSYVLVKARVISGRTKDKQPTVIFTVSG